MSPYTSLYAAAALAFAATAAAVSNLQAPSSAKPDSNATFTWSSDSSDTGPWILSLFSSGDPQTFPGGLAIANNVNPQSNQVTVLFPELVSPGSYIVSLVSASNTSDVIASSSPFSVGAAAPTSGAATSGATTSARPASSTRSGTSSATATAPPASISASLSSAASSISNAASSAASSARSVASSALSSLAAQSSTSASSSASPSTGAARALTPMWTSGASLALAMVLGGMAVGAVAL